MAKPFLKWVGGKRQLLPQLLEHLPLAPSALARPDGPRFFEPFMGGGALFFALEELGLARAVLNDFNPELVNVYRQVQCDPMALAARLVQPDLENTPEAFAAVRAWDRQADWPDRTGLDRAARFIYLNRTAFNGLWRVNSKGNFNVPYGKYRNPGLPKLELLQECARALANAEILEGDFEQAIAGVRPGDLVYFDPPYAPVSATSSFVGYTLAGFDAQMQERLAAVCARLEQQGVAWMLSNSDTPYTREIFGAIPGAQVHTVRAGRAINANAQGRGKVNELLVVGSVRGPQGA